MLAEQEHLSATRPHANIRAKLYDSLGRFSFLKEAAVVLVATVLYCTLSPSPLLPGYSTVASANSSQGIQVSEKGGKPKALLANDS